jgi:two-component system CheB/CheR fusion protein
VRRLRRKLQDNIGPSDAATEELKTAGEEAASIDREPQRTHQELETLEEELQSVSEELATVSLQLQAKVLELESLNDDLANLIGNTHIPVLFLDTELKVRRFTPAMEDLLGLTGADIGRPIAHFAQKFSGGDLTAEAAQVLATLEPLESEMRSHSGRWYLRRTLCYRTAEDRIAGVVVTFIDICARKQVEQLRLEAERANSAKDEFISTVSHELRTPLNTIRLWSRMFVNGQFSDDDVIKGGGMIDRAALAQQHLIDDLLDVSRMAAGQLRLDLREAPLLPALRSAIESMQPIAASRHVALTADLDARVGIVRADLDRIQQILWNLLSNAVKFTRAGGRVEVRAHRDDRTVEIEVSDTGCGIGTAFLPHVFDRFRQGEPGTARRYGGLGLGLSIARRLAELHGGTISARSEGEGRGAHFRVLLPLEARSVSPSEASPEPLEMPPITLARLDVLIVEDDPGSRETTSQMLEQRGAGVRQASSAAEARVAVNTRGPDVIVADIGMPEEDGYALIRGLRRAEQEQHTPRVPAIAVTAFTGSENRERALAAGFDEYLSKPVDPQRLVAAIALLAAKRVDAREQ